MGLCEVYLNLPKEDDWWSSILSVCARVESERGASIVKRTALSILLGIVKASVISIYGPYSIYTNIFSLWRIVVRPTIFFPIFSPPD